MIVCKSQALALDPSALAASSCTKKAALTVKLALVHKRLMVLHDSLPVMGYKTRCTCCIQLHQTYNDSQPCTNATKTNKGHRRSPP